VPLGGCRPPATVAVGGPLFRVDRRTVDVWTEPGFQILHLVAGVVDSVVTRHNTTRLHHLTTRREALTEILLKASGAT
jgi:hypothetical protein